MLKMMVHVKDSEIKEVKSPEQLKQMKKLLKRILSSVQSLGTFLSRVMYNMYSSEEQYSRRTEDFFSMCIMLNSLLKSKFTFYCYAIYLSKVIIHKKKKLWLIKRQKIKSKMKAFDDLIYMKKFLVDEKSQNAVRSFSAQYLRNSTNSKNIEKIEKMVPKGIHKFLKSSLFLAEDELKEVRKKEKLEKSTTVGEFEFNEHLQMDMSEFVVYINLHLKMNLDYVFSSELKVILKFFTAIEDFMENTFGNKELEVKIDMMRLIIRMTNATLFIDKLFMLDMMNIKYLQYWQTFSLFTQVLMSELRSVALEDK